MSQCSSTVKKLSLELGGNAPFVVFDDADLDAAVDGAMLAKFRNTGQSCIAANRFVVHEDVHDEFAERLAQRIDAMTIGDGLADPCPDLGPVIDSSRVEAVNSLVDEAISLGAKRLTQARQLPERGTFVAPSLLTDVPSTAGIATQEVFGPAAAVFRFRDADEAVACANRTEMGLAAYVWSSDLSRCWRTAERLEAGIVGVNNALPSVAFAPMGGVKQSGLGREGAALGLEEFEDVRYLALGL
jgi:succinate-semialdehyde dehydrogenase / glutarate-semialdehyde dehydrogenase